MHNNIVHNISARFNFSGKSSRVDPQIVKDLSLVNQELASAQGVILYHEAAISGVSLAMECLDQDIAFRFTPSSITELLIPFSVLPELLLDEYKMYRDLYSLTDAQDRLRKELHDEIIGVLKQTCKDNGLDLGDSKAVHSALRKLFDGWLKARTPPVKTWEFSI